MSCSPCCRRDSYTVNDSDEERLETTSSDERSSRDEQVLQMESTSSLSDEVNSFSDSHSLRSKSVISIPPVPTKSLEPGSTFTPISSTPRSQGLDHQAALASENENKQVVSDDSSYKTSVTEQPSESDLQETSHLPERAPSNDIAQTSSASQNGSKDQNPSSSAENSFAEEIKKSPILSSLFNVSSNLTQSDELESIEDEGGSSVVPVSSPLPNNSFAAVSGFHDFSLCGNVALLGINPPRFSGRASSTDFQNMDSTEPSDIIRRSQNLSHSLPTTMNSVLSQKISGAASAGSNCNLSEDNRSESDHDFQDFTTGSSPGLLSSGSWEYLSSASLPSNPTDEHDSHCNI